MKRILCPAVASCALLLAGVQLASTAPAGQASSIPVRDRIRAKMADVAALLSPGEVKLRGYLGARVAANAKNRMPAVDEERILAGFRKRPGEQAWIGEHVGKWLHAATLAWANTGDDALRAKLDRVVEELIKTQESDGYLGTYTPDARFGLFRNADWDVWVHKYDLIGLLTYHRYTGRKDALDAATKAADLLLRTFGPGKKSILSAGTHVGMASTSVLEPIVDLYRVTGDSRYLNFARYIVTAWDEPRGPRVLKTLLTERSVDKTANGKAYEMLSNVVGLCELARVTGEKQYLDAAVSAWEDVVAHQLYITGSASHHEHFHTPHDLPNHVAANVGETCVTVTWIQLNAQLLRLTGDSRYGDELERSYYNHLAAAQRPDGAQWCYYTALEGTKPYGPGINCCVSSGPRGMALAPQLAYLKGKDAGRDFLLVNLLESSTVTTSLGGERVRIEQDGNFPSVGSDSQGRTVLTIRTPRPAVFGIRFRAPHWTTLMAVSRGGNDKVPAVSGGGWAVLPPRRWKDGETVVARYTVPVRLAQGHYGNAGRAALLFGPIVLAYDEQRNPGGTPSPAIGLTEDSAARLKVRRTTGEVLAFEAPVGGVRDEESAVFVPFAEAGSAGGRYRVWLRAPGVPLPANESLFGFSAESRSRQGNVAGSIADGDPVTYVVTFDTRPRVEDWFAVQRDEPVLVRRVVFAHGHTFHDGGWFDASAGKPRVQIRRLKAGAWETVGVLDDYPATTATDPRGLKDGQSFALVLPTPVQAIGVRVVGRPAAGDNPNQSFASCAELQAF